MYNAINGEYVFWGEHVGEKLSKTNASVEKTLKLIEILAASAEPQRLSDLAAAADMPVATTLRMVNTLVQCGYAYQEVRGAQRYGLTMRFLQIGQMTLEHMSIRDVARPYLMELAEATGETCCLAVEDRGVVRYLDVLDHSRNSLQARQRVGGTAAMYATSSGKALLSLHTPEQMDAYFRDHPLLPLTDYTITQPDSLLRELAEVRATGVAYDREECEIGMRCMAAPIINGSQVMAAICLSGPVSRLTPERVETDLLPRLRRCAAQVTGQVCGVKREK